MPLIDDSLSILLVEDNADDAELISRALRKAGASHGLSVIKDGEAAIAYLQNFVQHDRGGAFTDALPALVLLDLKLPRRSGFEVLEFIRAHEPTRRIPVVVLTSSNQETDIRRAYDLGANSYLVKPVGGDALLAMMGALDAYWLKLNRAATS